MHPDIKSYHDSQLDDYKTICNLLYSEICKVLPDAEHKIWHQHPVWFIDGNPIVGYSKQNAGLRLMFWSGADFDEEELDILGNKFKDASIFFNNLNEIDANKLKRWLNKAKLIQWDYKNIVKRKGELLRLL